MKTNETQEKKRKNQEISMENFFNKEDKSKTLGVK